MDPNFLVEKAKKVHQIQNSAQAPTKNRRKTIDYDSNPPRIASRAPPDALYPLRHTCFVGNFISFFHHKTIAKNSLPLLKLKTNFFHFPRDF